MTNRRQFLKTAGLTAAAAAPAMLAAPHVKAQAPIRWRLQTYAGPALAEEVVRPCVDAFNKAANGQMEIELYTADQLVPTGELFRAMQAGTIDAVQSDDDSMNSPVDIKVFGGYFPFASRFGLDVPTLFYQFGLAEIWDQAYSEVGVKWLSAGAWDPCNFSTNKPIKTLEDLKGLRVFTFPTAGKFLTQFGVVPVTIPFEDVQVAMQTGEIDAIAWSGITEMKTSGWEDVTKYFLTNNISGGWCGSFFANADRWNEVPEHLQVLWRACMDSSHFRRLHWYWGGEARLRAGESKLELTTVPDAEWKTVEEKAYEFWEEVAAQSERTAKVVQILKDYQAIMEKAGPPYRNT
ncbi:Twin-arginine translocation pathway signal [Pseudorhizobium banfieldiae]|uniref:Twin-arginine translocation pathway signal n=1 Tax=Pseudorhizobium banfieldiae TaxID=1125847 RepID=L0NGA6_9HYPH|nr:TRAP transporter substrate-binding protein [Pseudorhizobium banfieldiae]CAD6613153.1 C4-dicarboxylate ABC transporter [arsenite-oxidising bacterium NT-25]CAD6617223.1 C4-dicarboxylate ABC transporter [Rhizobium sp. TCK]CCF19914.1 Twin-arginine translocation pathway signal [Pseudorhizobium banfieldiae]